MTKGEGEERGRGADYKPKTSLIMQHSCFTLDGERAQVSISISGRLDIRTDTRTDTHTDKRIQTER